MLDALPFELLVHILSFIKPFTLTWSRVARVNHRCNQAAHDPITFLHHQIDYSLYHGRNAEVISDLNLRVLVECDLTQFSALQRLQRVVSYRDGSDTATYLKKELAGCSRLRELKLSLVVNTPEVRWQRWFTLERAIPRKLKSVGINSATIVAEAGVVNLAMMLAHRQQLTSLRLPRCPKEVALGMFLIVLRETRSLVEIELTADSGLTYVTPCLNEVASLQRVSILQALQPDHFASALKIRRLTYFTAAIYKNTPIERLDEYAAQLQSCTSLQTLRLSIASWKHPDRTHGAQFLISALAKHRSITSIYLQPSDARWSSKMQLSLVDVINNPRIVSFTLDVDQALTISATRLVVTAIQRSKTLRHLRVVNLPVWEALESNRGLLSFDSQIYLTMLAMKVVSVLIAQHPTLLSVSLWCMTGKRRRQATTHLLLDDDSDIEAFSQLLQAARARGMPRAHFTLIGAKADQAARLAHGYAFTTTVVNYQLDVVV